MNTRTWADLHPEVAEVFRGAWIEWPCEKIDTGLTPVDQPCITQGEGQELFVAGIKGEVFHSTDLGKTWSLLGTSPAFVPRVPQGMKRVGFESLGGYLCCGIGITSKQTFLITWATAYNDGRSGWSHRDETFHWMMWATRSENRGKTWEPTALFDPAPYQVAGDQATLLSLRDGRLMAPIRVQAWSRPGSSVSLSENIFRSFVYTSSDDGKTWSKLSRFKDHSTEPHLLELPSGRIVASVRYQRCKLPEDPQELATPFPPAPGNWPEGCTSPTDIGQTVFQNTAFTVSEDGGLTWSAPRLITGTCQQSGCLVRLSDETLVLTFGRWGQRFMLSYDQGKTWSKAVYQLNATGEYARSVIVKDDRIVTVHDSQNGTHPRRLGVLRWKVPSRKEFQEHGFFAPREVEAGLR